MSRQAHNPKPAVKPTGGGNGHGGNGFNPMHTPVLVLNADRKSVV